MDNLSNWSEDPDNDFETKMNELIAKINEILSALDGKQIITKT